MGSFSNYLKKNKVIEIDWSIGEKKVDGLKKR